MRTRRRANFASVSPRSYVIGIDEVGRGALAGPVVVAAACLPKGLIIRKQILGILKDSKKLSPSQRERWFAYFKRHRRIRCRIARVYQRGVDKLNITKAANRAATRAFGRLIKICKLSARGGSASGGKVESCRVFLDGGLFLESKRRHTETGRRPNADKRISYSASVSVKSVLSQCWSATTVIRGDEKITAVKIASIIAKVNRDRYMERLSKKYPEYGFEIHKGYGTKKHFAAIKKHGSSKVHRLTFLRFSEKS